ncbi:transcriptional regulator, LysR family [Ditylenchus destructor]|nr:transcriptional regulator, LysR family [Ditylenchus destructor]
MSAGRRATPRCWDAPTMRSMPPRPRVAAAGAWLNERENRCRACAAVAHARHRRRCDRSGSRQDRAARGAGRDGFDHGGGEVAGHVLSPGLAADRRTQPGLEEPAVATAAGGAKGGGSALTETGRALVGLYRQIEATALQACKSEIRQLMKLLAS